MSAQSFAIIGGGIGGLTLAIAMQQKGFQVTVYESAEAIKPVGAGLGLAANAVKAFTEIGISDSVLKAGKVIKRLSIKDYLGKKLNETDAEKINAKHYIINHFTIHRADLHAVLLDQLGAATLQLGKTCVDFKQTPDGVVLFFNDGSTVKADYVIAADGIHSVFRKKLLPGSTPRYAGYTCWRAVIDHVPTGINLDEVTETWAPGRRFGIAPLNDRRIYWYACINAEAQDDDMRSFRIPDLLAYFGDFHDPIPEILQHTRADQLIWGDIMDLKPLRRFAFGNIILMGDAAHATTPNMGQGACMAVEDAVVLANCLENYLTPLEAFQKFEGMRIGHTTKIVNASWMMGKVAQLQDPLLIALRNMVMRLTPPWVVEKRMEAMFNNN